MDLTSLASVKAWLKSATTDDDVLLKRLISQVSGAILDNLQRPPLVRATYTETRDGLHNQRMMLRNWPAAGVSSLLVDGVSIPAAGSAAQAGYYLVPWDGTSAGNPQELILRGYWFTRGNANVQITYDAGYCVEDEAAAVPADPYSLTLTPAKGPWAQDDGVTYADGTALTKIRSGTPAEGQYVVTKGDFGAATYQFAAADQGQGLLVSYSYVPPPLEEACIEWIGERYRYKDRIGQSSKSVGGNETAAYSLKGMPDFVDMLIDPFRKSIPL